MIQKAKRKLALLLAAVMLVGLLPTAAFAAGGEEPSGGAQITEPSDGTSTTTPPVETQPGGEDDTVPPTETQPGGGDDTVPPTETQPGGRDDTVPPTETQPTEPEVVPVALSYDDLLLSTISQNQPFSPGTLNSTTFRIPALVTLDDGTLVAAADARWGGYADGENTDTMVAVSSDNGQSWTTSLVNYFADTTDAQQSGAASFIDPALATDGETVYLLVDAFPGGVDGLSDCKEGTGYNESGYLMLSKKDSDSYDYYVGVFSEGYAPVLGTGGTDTGYAVDEHYNLYTVADGEYTAVAYPSAPSYGDGTYVPANVFYQNADFTVFPTSYLWLVKSTDGGVNWSAPQILNADVKSDSESFYGVGPGRGLVASDGTIYFSCYQHGGWDAFWGSNVEKSSLIYSTDGGKTWNRTDNLDNANGGYGAYWSSENQAVQLNDGTIRMFFRNGRGTVCYADLNANGSWSSPVSLESTMASIGYQHICSTCQVSAIHYSQTINGKEALLVSCPSVLNSRTNGNIFVFTVNDDNSLTAAYSYQVNTGAFQYSCLTELSDGSIGILYEDGDASITYKTIAMDAIAPGAVIGGVEESDPIKATDGTLLDGALFSLKVNGQPRTVSVDLAEGKTLSAQSSDTGVVTAGVNGYVVTLTPVAAGSTTVTLTVSTLSRAAGDTATATLNVTVAANDVIDIEPAIDLFVGDSETVQVPDNVSGEEPVYGEGGEAFVSVEVGQASSSTADGSYLLGTPTTTLSNGTYVIAYGNNALTGSLDSETISGAGSTVDDSMVWTITRSGSVYTIRNSNGAYLALDWWGNLATSNSDTTWEYSDNKLSTPFAYIDSRQLHYSNGRWSATRNSGSSLTIYPATYQKGETTWTTPVTFTGVAAGTTTVTIGNYQYTVNVTEKPPFDASDYPIISNTGSTDYSKGREVEYLILARGSSYDLDVQNASSVTWESANSSIASINQNGTITAKAIGKTTITAHITDGSSQGDKIVHVTVVDPGTGYYGRTIEFYVADVQNSNLYYVENGHTGTFDFNQVQDHTVIYGNVYGKWNMVFFAAPHDGYALTYLSAANNYGNTDWTSIKDNQLVNPNNSAFQDAYGPTYYNRVLAQAQGTYGADGCFWFTRANSDGGTGNCQAYIISISEKLPTVEKKIVSVDGEPYEPGMSAQKGDQVKFEITVTSYPSTYGISYSNARLTDTLTAAGTPDWTYKSPNLNSTGTQTFEYIYTVVDGDIDKTILNTVSLSYNYSAKYSEGSYNVSDTASAQLTALPFTPKNYVVDFGMPVQFDMSLSDEGEEILSDFTSATSAQGMTVNVLSNAHGRYRIIQYTPTKAFTNVDTVTVTNENGSQFSFKVYPATTVYYDGSFVKNPNGMPIVSPSTTQQTASAVGSKARYGYQANYSNAAYGTLTDKVSFSFTGTGVDVYANTTSNSCYVAVWLYDSNNNLEGLYLVDTAMKAGNYAYTQVPTGTSYNVPIVSLTNLERDTYRVEIQRIDPQKGAKDRADVDLSGFRVYGTMDFSSSIYVQDGEATPTFTEVRNSVLETLGNTLTEVLTNQFEQVYDEFGADISAVIEGLANVTDAADDFLLNGPKNEVYLTGDQTLTITLPAGGTYQLGLKSLDAATGSVNINGNSVDVTNVDMFYVVDASKGAITIKAEGDNFISVSMLKSFSN